MFLDNEFGKSEMSEGHKRLQGLAHDLRHGPDPEGFEWDFTTLTSCALGFYFRSKGTTYGRACHARGVVGMAAICSLEFDISAVEADAIFARGIIEEFFTGRKITREMVVRRIEDLLAEKYPQAVGAKISLPEIKMEAPKRCLRSLLYERAVAV